MVGVLTGQNVLFDILELSAFQKISNMYIKTGHLSLYALTHSSWNHLCLCLCFGLFTPHRCMIICIVHFSLIDNLMGLMWSCNDLKWIGIDSDF